MAEHRVVRSIVWAVGVALLLVGLAPPAQAQSNGTVQLSGVLRTGSGTPVGDATVSVEGSSGSSATRTAADGSYRLQAPVGDAQLAVSFSRFEQDPSPSPTGGPSPSPSPSSSPAPSGSGTSFFVRAPVSFTESRQQDLRVPDLVRLRVTLTDAAGPVAGARVEAFASPARSFELFPGARASGSANAFAGTRSDGTATLQLLPADSAEVRANKSEGSSNRTAVARNVDATTDRDIALRFEGSAPPSPSATSSPSLTPSPSASAASTPTPSAATQDPGAGAEPAPVPPPASRPSSSTDPAPATASPSSTPSAQATAGPSLTPTPTPTPTPAPTPPAATPSSTCEPLRVALERRTSDAGRSVGATVSGSPGTRVELLGYSRPATSYRRLRSGVLPPGGVLRFLLVPTSNTRVVAVEEGCSPSASVAVDVRSTIRLAGTRSGSGYRFSGSVSPKRAGQRVDVYRRAVDGGPLILVTTTRTTSTGAWAVLRRFTGAGRFAFVARTAGDGTNAPGQSAPRTMDVMP